MWTIEKRMPWKTWEPTAFRFTERKTALWAAKNMMQADPEQAERGIRVVRVGTGCPIVFCRRVASPHNIAAEGRYELVDGLYYLREWRISFTREDGTISVGHWHKVHGRQQKNVGSLKLVRDTPPPIDPWLEYTGEEVMI